jgi:HD domain
MESTTTKPSSSRSLLERIAALRSRLDREHGAAETPIAPPHRIELPPDYRLTGRAAKLLHESRDLLEELKSLAEHPDVGDELGILHPPHREAAGMLDVVLRTLLHLPTEAAAQLRLCEGLQMCLVGVRDRIGLVRTGLTREDDERRQLDTLANLLGDLDDGRVPPLDAFLAIARSIVDDVGRGQPLRFRPCPTADSALFAATQGLAMAQVQAWILRAEIPHRGRLAEAIVPALVHDVGMLHVPAEILFREGPLDDEARRILHEHPRHSGRIVRRLWPGGGWPVEVAEDHHERLDGSGYPCGKLAHHLGEPARLAMACDVYAALRSPRPHRSALEPSASLSDALSMSEVGLLDPLQTEKLLRLTFHPVGSIVQLSDGSTALVVGTPKALAQAGKATVLPLRRADGQLPPPWPIDLGETPNLTISRALSPRERARLLGRAHPLLV